MIKNTVANSFIGCCMAFRAQLKDQLLPMPQNVPMHDWWIGLLGSLAGRASFIDTPLMAYRRHAGTATVVNTGGFRGKFFKLPAILKDRWRISSLVLGRVLEGRRRA